jgi:hypothetical protein
MARFITFGKCTRKDTKNQQVWGEKVQIWGERKK